MQCCDVAMVGWRDVALRPSHALRCVDVSASSISYPPARAGLELGTEAATHPTKQPPCIEKFYRLPPLVVGLALLLLNFECCLPSPRAANMRYIRFLKPPRVERNTLKTLITITSDLGETFLPDDVTLAATLRSDDPDGDIYLRKTLKWTGGMRSFPIVFDLAFTDLDWPIRVHVGTKGSPNSDHFEKHHNAEPPSIISAWSGLIDVPKGINEAEKKVERRFTPLSNRTLSIWEETGESIACHLWYSSSAS